MITMAYSKEVWSSKRKINKNGALTILKDSIFFAQKLKKDRILKLDQRTQKGKQGNLTRKQSSRQINVEKRSGKRRNKI